MNQHHSEKRGIQTGQSESALAGRLRPSAKRGFTLIELLVVIAIIAILAAILFPVFLSAKARSQQLACLQNMKELGTAVYSYLGDWNQTYPMNRYRDPLMPSTGRMDGSRFNWKTSVFPFVKSRNGVWQCAANLFRTQDDETGKGVPTVQSLKFPISYAINGDFFNNLDSNYNCPKRTLSDIPKPTRLLFVIESRFDAPDLNSGMIRYVGNPSAHITGHDGLSWMTVHSGCTSNFLFADCHARTMKVQNTLSPRTMWVPSAGGSQSDYDAIAKSLAPECYQN